MLHLGLVGATICERDILATRAETILNIYLSGEPCFGQIILDACFVVVVLAAVVVVVAVWNKRFPGLSELPGAGPCYLGLVGATWGWSVLPLAHGKS